MVIRVPGPRSTQAGSYAALDDRMLVLDFQAGHIEAFVEIHHRYDALARHVCGRFLRNPQDVEEAVQDSWIRVFQGLHRFNGRYALQPWISRVATNVSLDLLRARARRPQLDDHPIDEHEREDQADGPEEEVEKLIQRDLVIAVLAGLPDTHRRALVLRELEGRSHKEIGSELEISPAQAKALIHRAKGTFRREWLRAATERHGLAGIFLLPLLWLAKIGGMGRRLVDRAGEVAHAGGTEVVTQMAQAASTPIIPAAATSVGEKIVAAGLTLIVAGGVTVGAATLAGDRAGRDDPKSVVAAPIAAPRIDQSPGAAALVDEAAEKGAKEGRSDDMREGRPEQEVVPPADDPVDAQEPVPSPSPSDQPSADPTTDPTPVIPPAPAWGFSFTTTGRSVETCSCDPSYRLMSAEVNGALGGNLSFSQVVRGVVFDVDGEATWPVYLEESGSLDRDGGRLEFSFEIYTAAGGFWYDGVAILSESATDDAGSYLYRFDGSYAIRGGGEPPAGIPRAGTVSAMVSIWPDETIYLGSFALTETLE